MKASTIRKISFSSFTILLLFIIWIIISTTKNNDMIYPSIGSIFKAVLNCFKWVNFKLLLMTFLRVIITLAISLIVCLIIITITLKFPDSYAFFSPIVKIMRTVPFICVSLFIVLFFKRGIAPYIIAFLVIIPIMLEGFLSGVKQINKNIIEDLKLLEISFPKKLFQVYLPLAFPTIMMTIFQTFGLGFKVVIMGEYFAQTKNSLGLALYDAKAFLEMSTIFAWTIIIVIVVAIIEIIMNYFNNKRNNLIY